MINNAIQILKNDEIRAVCGGAILDGQPPRPKIEGFISTGIQDLQNDEVRAVCGGAINDNPPPKPKFEGFISTKSMIK
jgi:hypothetical protein